MAGEGAREEVFGPGGAECVFCHPEAQPGALLEDEHVRLIPDLYPVVPGHLLLVSREHLPAYGAAPTETLEELERMSAVAAEFVGAAYSAEFVLWENGGAGQTVYHAHLHVMPVRPAAIHEVIDSEHMDEVDGWPAVADYWRKQGPYHYLQFEGHRRIAAGNSAANWEFRRRLALSAGMRYVDGAWVRPTSRADVDEVPGRWSHWATRNLAGDPT